MNEEKKLQRCERGHFYDAEKYSYCPYCRNENSSEDMTNTVARITPTTTTTKKGQGEDIKRMINSINEFGNYDDDEKTVTISSRHLGKEPVVGWLVCIAGDQLGESFQLKTSRNFIGRSKESDIVLEGDSSVSRSKHAIIVYVPKERIFIAQPGESRELYYINDKVVLNNEILMPYDTITIGKIKLLFIPLCGENFTWENILQNE